jgi:hypothetical protein
MRLDDDVETIVRSERRAQLRRDIRHRENLRGRRSGERRRKKKSSEESHPPLTHERKCSTGWAMQTPFCRRFAYGLAL